MFKENQIFKGKRGDQGFGPPPPPLPLPTWRLKQAGTTTTTGQAVCRVNLHGKRGDEFTRLPALLFLVFTNRRSRPIDRSNVDHVSDGGMRVMRLA